MQVRFLAGISVSPGISITCFVRNIGCPLISNKTKYIFLGVIDPLKRFLNSASK
jgi:hypothetical protein